MVGPFIARADRLARASGVPRVVDGRAKKKDDGAQRSARPTPRRRVAARALASSLPPPTHPFLPPLFPPPVSQTHQPQNSLSAKRFAHKRCLGHRPISKDGEAGAYTFVTYGQVASQVEQAGAAFVALGASSRERVAVLGANCPEWMVAMQVGCDDCAWSFLWTLALCGALFPTPSSLSVPLSLTHNTRSSLPFVARPKQSHKTTTGLQPPQPGVRAPVRDARRDGHRVHPRAQRRARRGRAGRQAGAHGRRAARAAAARRRRRERRGRRRRQQRQRRRQQRRERAQRQRLAARGRLLGRRHPRVGRRRRARRARRARHRCLGRVSRRRRRRFPAVALLGRVSRARRPPVLRPKPSLPRGHLYHHVHQRDYGRPQG